MSATTVYAAEVLDTIAERRNLEQFTGTPLFIHSGVDDELVGWLGCRLPSSGYPCEHMGMGDEGSTACWSATEINRLREENAKLRDLCERFGEYASQDRCEGCACKSRCNDGDVDECWQLTEIRGLERELGVGRNCNGR